jgi:tRNA(fMet)-specific endonuclease VapC
MTYLLDTNIISAHLRRPAGLQHRFIQHGGRIAVPTIVLAELYAWAFGKDDPLSLSKTIATVLEDLSIVDFDAASALEFGRLRVELRRQGKAVSPPDLMIASTALAHDLIVVTDNTRHFEVIPDLRRENWLEP